MYKAVKLIDDMIETCDKLTQSYERQLQILSEVEQHLNALCELINKINERVNNNEH